MFISIALLPYPAFRPSCLYQLKEKSIPKLHSVEDTSMIHQKNDKLNIYYVIFLIWNKN